jgi:hypothetical protein
MVRKQVYITKEQDERLKNLSLKVGVSEAELIRRAINSLDDELAGRVDLNVALDIIEQLTRRRAPAEQSLAISRADIYRDHPRHLDRQAWLEELEFIEERARLLPTGGSTRKWRREDSYDGRRSRLSS